MSPEGGAEVRVRGLEVRYPGTRTPVLRGVDLDIPPGGTCAVVGESGSGKSVLVRALLCLAPISSGQVVVGDVDLTEAAGSRLRAARQRIGTVFQSPVDSLDPRWSARRTVAEALVLRDGGVLRDRLDAAGGLLDDVGIPVSRHDALPGTLSGGECQRVAIARAVAGGPDLVLADEPTAMLDPGVADLVLGLLARLKEEMGFSLVLVTHHLRELDQLPGALLVLCAGRPVEWSASPPDRPAHPFSRYLWDAATRPVEPVTLAPLGCPFRPGCPRAVDQCAHHYPDPVEVKEAWKIWCYNREI